MALTNAGREWLAKSLAPNPPAVISHVGVGTGTVAENNADTALGQEVLTRAPATLTVITTTVTNDTLQIIGRVNNSSTQKVIGEVGAFNASSGGTMVVRFKLTAAVTLEISDSIEPTFLLKFS